MSDQASKLREMMRIKKNDELHLLTVTGANGQVGKTSIAFNLAVLLQGMGKKVLLVRTDMRSRGEIAECPDTLAGLLEKDLPLEGKPKLDRDGVAHLFGGSLSTLLSLGSRLTCSGFAQLGELADIVIFDVESGDADLAAEMIAVTGQAILVASPQQTPLVDCFGIVKSLSRQGAAEAAVLLLLNKAPEREAAWNVLDHYTSTLKKKIDINIAWQGTIPLDAHVVLADELRQPFVTLFPTSAATRAMAELANGYMIIPHRKHRLFEQAEIIG